MGGGWRSVIIENKTHRFVRSAFQDMKATFWKALKMVLLCNVNIYFILLIIIYHTVQKKKRAKESQYSAPFLFIQALWKSWLRVKVVLNRIIISKSNVISDWKKIILIACQYEVSKRIVCSIFRVPKSLNIFIHTMWIKDYF